VDGVKDPETVLEEVPVTVAVPVNEFDDKSVPDIVLVAVTDSDVEAVLDDELESLCVMDCVCDSVLIAVPDTETTMHTESQSAQCEQAQFESSTKNFFEVTKILQAGSGRGDPFIGTSIAN
jgi:hypothetical protein